MDKYLSSGNDQCAKEGDLRLQQNCDRGKNLWSKNDIPVEVQSSEDGKRATLEVDASETVLSGKFARLSWPVLVSPRLSSSS